MLYSYIYCKSCNTHLLKEKATAEVLFLNIVSNVCVQDTTTSTIATNVTNYSHGDGKSAALHSEFNGLQLFLAMVLRIHIVFSFLGCSRAFTGRGHVVCVVFDAVVQFCVRRQ